MNCGRELGILEKSMKNYGSEPGSNKADHYKKSSKWGTPS